MKAKVIEIQVCGLDIHDNLYDACIDYVRRINEDTVNKNIHFGILLPSGGIKYITVRQEDDQVVAYGNFEGLPSATNYAKGGSK